MEVPAASSLADMVLAGLQDVSSQLGSCFVQRAFMLKADLAMGPTGSSACTTNGIGPGTPASLYA